MEAMDCECRWRKIVPLLLVLVIFILTKKKKKQTLSYFANKRRQSFPLTSHRRLEAVQSRQPPGDTNKGLAQHRYDVAVLFD